MSTRMRAALYATVCENARRITDSNTRLALSETTCGYKCPSTRRVPDWRCELVPVGHLHYLRHWYRLMGVQEYRKKSVGEKSASIG
ncbi:hypothetical protein PENTCL1PPCAC_24358 [Pristionchus entomophagus]|uniref:Ribosomal protein n=1 Tax=Pristionchus entomophagus TaxID=358040 RepID=A0AAV5U7S9_9BILA|nr:hypothetical protein PENTCL1PPCAC_24358 [Pristionchus entomophagus]